MEQKCYLNDTALSSLELLLQRGNMLADMVTLISEFVNGLVSAIHPPGVSEEAGAIEGVFA